MPRTACLLLIVSAVICAGQEVLRGNVTMENPVLLVGSPLVAKCQADVSGWLEPCGWGSGEGHLVWRLGQQELPSEWSQRLGPLTSRLEVPAGEGQSGKLQCILICPRENHLTVDAITVWFGYPPDIPQNRSCFSESDGRTMNCTWDIGRETLIETIYEVNFTWTAGGEFSGCQKQGNHVLCMMVRLAPTMYEFCLVARNELGINVSDVEGVLPEAVVKPSPPDIVEISGEPTIPDFLEVKWKHALARSYSRMLFELRYKLDGTDHWKTLTKDRIMNSQQYSLHKLQPASTYWIQLRCKTEDGLYWSDWSNGKKETTNDRAPGQSPQVWRIIDEPNSEGKRNVTILWKLMDRHVATGVILRYNVCLALWKSPNATILAVSLGPTETRWSCFLHSGETYMVNFTAENGGGASPPARLIIPAIGLPVTRAPATLSVSSVEQSEGGPGNFSISVAWSPLKTQQQHEPLGYVVEWQALCTEDRKPCFVGWQRMPSNARGCILHEHLEPGMLYNVSFYAEHTPSWYGRPVSALVYAKEERPLAGPIPVVTSFSRNSVTVQWSSLRLLERRGFVHHYKVYYGVESLSKYVEVPGNQRSVVLSGLKAGSHYLMRVSAVTGAGEGPHSPQKKFGTTLIDDWEVLVIVASVCVLLLIIVATSIFLCLHFQKSIKEFLCVRDLPNPIIQWLIMEQGRGTGCCPRPPPCRERDATETESVVIVEELGPDSPFDHPASPMDELEKVMHKSQDGRSLGGEETSGVGSSRPSSPDHQRSVESLILPQTNDECMIGDEAGEPAALISRLGYDRPRAKPAPLSLDKAMRLAIGDLAPPSPEDPPSEVQAYSVVELTRNDIAGMETTSLGAKAPYAGQGHSMAWPSLALRPAAPSWDWPGSDASIPASKMIVNPSTQPHPSQGKMGDSFLIATGVLQKQNYTTPHVEEIPPYLPQLSGDPDYLPQ
uniref:interleukin-6 receptor subunit beta-like n=1 Tax=Myxine glutinosa TaxID=7769 RepID=UPI00358F579C